MKTSANIAKNISYIPDPVPVLPEHHEAYLRSELNKLRDTIDRINESILLIRNNLHI